MKKEKHQIVIETKEKLNEELELNKVRERRDL